METILSLQKLGVQSGEAVINYHSWLSIACHGKDNSLLSISCVATTPGA